MNKCTRQWYYIRVNVYGYFEVPTEFVGVLSSRYIKLCGRKLSQNTVPMIRVFLCVCYRSSRNGPTCTLSPGLTLSTRSSSNMTSTDLGSWPRGARSGISCRNAGQREPPDKFHKRAASPRSVHCAGVHICGSWSIYQRKNDRMAHEACMYIHIYIDVYSG